MLYRRREYTTLIRRLEEKRRFMQIVIGPRQIGKTTLSDVLGVTKKVTPDFLSGETENFAIQYVFAKCFLFVSVNCL